MNVLYAPMAIAAAVLATFAASSGAFAQSTPTEQDIVRALSHPPAETTGFARTRSLAGDRGLRVTGGTKSAPSIDLKVTFAFDSARLDNESMLTLNVLGRALSSAALEGRSIEIVGHTDARGSLEYNDALSQRRAAAVVSYLVRKFPLDGSLLSSKGMGERRLLDPKNPEAAVNRRVEIRNVTKTR